ncbi:hypothetical protein T10_8471 [Trichinella papuae]|uniref:Uncharacterized protein n=1 Tax=Trichinella papuae TaxID=268474 RepID=A0A0V1M9K7_9BILA|nr:hypothetical protein T10_8471 [Trichinella papuae]
MDESHSRNKSSLTNGFLLQSITVNLYSIERPNKKNEIKISLVCKFSFWSFRLTLEDENNL